MLGVSGTTQYINPDYVQPLPTSLDAKNSPLALLAQTCSSIGKDSNSSSTPSSSSSSSSSASTSKLHQHQQIHSSSSDKKDLNSRLANGKDGSVRIKSSDSCSTTVDHNGVHNHSGLGGSNYSHYKLSSSGKCYMDRGPKENGRSSAGRVSVSPPKHKLSSNNGLGLNGTKHHLPKSDNGGSYRNSMAYYNGKIPDDYASGSLSSVHHHQQSKLSPTAAASPLQSLKMQQDLFNAAFSMGYPPWMIGQSPFMPPAFDPFLLSAAALSSQQHKQQLIQLHQQLFSSLSGYQASDLGAAAGLGSSSGSSHKHDTDAGVSPSGKSSGAGQSSGGNAILPSTSLPNLFPISTSHIPSQSGSQSQLSPTTHPYSCNWFQPGSDFCGKRFASYEELLEHLKSHVTTPGANLSAADDSRLFPASMFPFMFGMTPSFAMPSGYNLNSNYLLQHQQQAAAASLFQRSFSPSSTPTSSTSSLSSSSSSSHLSSRYHPYKSPLSSSSTSVSSSLPSSSSLFSGLLPFPSPSSAVTSPFSALMPPFGYGFPYPMYNQKVGETGAGP